MSDVIRRGGQYVVVLFPGEKARVGDCKDCFYYRGHVSWWCKNREASIAHRTSIPGRTDCSYWKEAERWVPPPRLPWYRRVLEALR